MLRNLQPKGGDQFFNKVAHATGKGAETKRACAPCGRRKAKCDGEQPCGRCKSYREAAHCEYLKRGQRSSGESAGTLKEYKKILEQIFPGINITELKDLSRKKLLERIPKDSLVDTSSPESDLVEEQMSRIHSDVSNSQPQPSPEETYDTSYTEPLQGRGIMSPVNARSSPSRRSPCFGPSNSVSSRYSPTLNWQTTSVFSHFTAQPQTLSDSQIDQRRANTYNFYPTTWTDDHPDIYLPQHIAIIPYSVDMEAHPQSTLYQFPLSEHNRHPRPSAGPPLSSAELYLDSRHNPATEYAYQSQWCNPTTPLDVTDRLSHPSGIHSNPMNGPRNEAVYWPDLEGQTGSSNTSR